ncbi:MAG TPA: NUDIX hydrolase [Balneolaceae bacterium]|nr:NUDIX hydrolase [Balneolaceae bacterium]
MNSDQVVESEGEAFIEIEAAGGAVCRFLNHKPQVLLIRRNGIWDLPKGKKEPGESAMECARREVEEETGIRGIILKEYLGTTRHSYQQDGQNIEKKTFWYLMKAEDDKKLLPQKEEGITQVAWTNLEEALKQVGFQNLREILEKVRDQIA